jgi:methyl-accepting chemotaxis protein
MFKNELPKIKEGFSKVKNDMLFLSDKISENYTEFISHHKDLSKQVNHMANQLQHQISNIKESIEHANLNPQDTQISNHEIEKMKSEIRQLKQIVNDSHGEHLKISSLVENLKQAKSKHTTNTTSFNIKESAPINKMKTDIKKLKEQTKSSELELYLLKEKLSQKDDEIKDLKDISRKMFDIIDDLSRVELDLVNHQIKT